MFNYELPEGWYWAKVEDVQAETKRATITGPFGSSIGSRFFVESGVPVIRGNNLKVGSEKFVDDGFVYITDEKAEELSGYKAIHDDLIFTAAGTLGQVGVIPRSAKFDYYIISNKQMRARFNKEIVDSQFAYYWFSSPKMVAYVNALDTGSTIPLINLGILRSLPLPVPPLSMQEKISAILCSFDNKIALNRQINTTLESMAQALFKSWFVDFDPVIDNALAAGNEIPDELAARAARREALRQQTNKTAEATYAASSEQALPDTGLSDQRLPSEIQQLFPDRFVLTEEMGWVPEGWEVKSVVDMVESISDTYPIKSVEKVIFLNTGDILEGTFLHRNYSTTEGLPGQAKKSIKKGDILYSEIRPQNKRFAYVDFDGGEYVVSTKLMVLRSKGALHSLFPYFLLKQQSSIDMMQHAAESRSGTFPQITYKQLDQLLVCVPSDSQVIDWFVENTLKPVFEQSRKLDAQSQTLSNVRDSLLPKLLSGQITIPDAEQQLAEVL